MFMQVLVPVFPVKFCLDLLFFAVKFFLDLTDTNGDGGMSFNSVRHSLFKDENYFKLYEQVRDCELA